MLARRKACKGTCESCNRHLGFYALSAGHKIAFEDFKFAMQDGRFVARLG